MALTIAKNNSIVHGLPHLTAKTLHLLLHSRYSYQVASATSANNVDPRNYQDLCYGVRLSPALLVLLPCLKQHTSRLTFETINT